MKKDVRTKCFSDNLSNNDVWWDREAYEEWRRKFCCKDDHHKDHCGDSRWQDDEDVK
ncbi:hypothetical protein [Paenibacillus sp. YAF4_2]|uniref:hypothetical protein n=1 Tax=Paenibacillus sp. YAF4_2 TaxID=3233085 RepID=UPI003F9575CD